MNGKRVLDLVLVAALAVIVALVAVRWFSPGPGATMVAKGTTNFGDIATDAQVAAGTYVSAGSYVNAASYSKAGTWFRGAKQGAVTVTEGSTITATGTYQPVTASEAVTTSTTLAIITSTVTVGDLLVLLNTGENAITVDNGGATVLAGAADVALGTNDAMTLVFDGTNWVQIGASNN